MPALARFIAIATLVAATLASPLSRAQPIIYDATQTGFASPLGPDNSGYLGVYVHVDGSWVLLHFYAWNQRSTDLDFISPETPRLYFRSGDCSGPALITGDGLGTVPNVFWKERKHAWLRMADSATGLGLVTTESFQEDHETLRPSTRISWPGALRRRSIPTRSSSCLSLCAEG